MSEAIHKTKELAIDVGCPILIGVQAREKSDGRIPGLSDCYYSSSVSHVVDKNFGLLKPVKHHDRGDVVSLNDAEYLVDDNLFFIGMSKQRMDQGSRKWAINFDMAKMEVSDFDTEKIRLALE